MCRPFFFFFFSPHSDVRKEGDAQVHASFTSIYHQVRLILQPSAPFSTRMLLLERDPGDMFCVYAPTVWWAWTRLGWKIHQHLFSLSLSLWRNIGIIHVCLRVLQKTTRQAFLRPSGPDQTLTTETVSFFPPIVSFGKFSEAFLILLEANRERVTGLCQHSRL